MIIIVQGEPLYVYTGGRAFDAAKPTMLFIHGVLNDHSVWGLQSRYFAHHGWNVLAPDLPGHNRSMGAPPDSVEAAALAVIALLDTMQIDRIVLIGHSFGSLIALEAASRIPDRVDRLALLGIAYPMRVSEALLESSVKAPEEAIRLVTRFSYSGLAAPPSALGPGTWLPGLGRALMRRVLASNPDHNPFYAGFLACDRYVGGAEAIGRVHCPILFVLGDEDQMTPAKRAKGLIEQARSAEVLRLPVGHQMMSEAPDRVLEGLRVFVK